MYADISPVQNFPPSKSGQVLVLEETDKNVDAIIEMAREEGAVSHDGEDEIFWIVFENNPRRVIDFTEKSLRQSIK